MKKFFLSLAVFVMAICANAQTNQYFWYQGNLMMGNPIAQIDSVTFGEGEPADTLHILLPRTIIKTVHDTVIKIVHDTVYIHDCDTVQWKGFTLEATEDNTTIQHNYERRTGNIYSNSENYDCTTIPGSLWYSYDASDWIEWNCLDIVTLNKGQKIFLKGNKPYYAILDNLYHYLEITNGFAKGYGNISSLFDNTDNCTKTTFGDCALTDFFRGSCEIALSFHEGVTEIGTTFTFSYSFCNKVEHQETGDGITAIELPSTLTKIGCTAFQSCQMTELSIPRSVIYIGYFAFAGCTRLQDVHYLGTIAEWNNINKSSAMFHNSPSVSVIHCIDGDVAL